MVLLNYIKFPIIVLISFILVGCGDESLPGSKNNEKIVRIGTADNNGRLSGLLGLAKQLGYLEEELQKVDYQYSISGFAGAGPAVNEGLATNAIDIAVYADFPGIIATSRGVPLKLIMSEDSSINANIAVRKDSNIHSLADLKGKKVALPRGTYMQRYFTLFIEQQGYKLSDFNIIQMTNDAESALLNGAIDAMVWTEQSTARLENKSPTITTLYSTRTEPELSGISVIVGREAFINQNENVIKAMSIALLKASKYAQNNPDQAEILLAKESDTNVEIIKKIHDFHSIDSFSKRYSVNITDNDISKLKQTQQFLIDNKIITKPIDIKNWVYTKK
ncbi:ABC transporter substrate-binding protein [Providencia hangzhouensis]|uniref:ABC transporter substrate-binding protein n=1 Tax=Providencia rettgeri TaxID=587 RepID=A0AAJ4NK32_PRORE|nr:MULTISPECIES: ABC transporter substrate-binding protein [Providencia]MBJ9973259.1 ABC transporter substrate-binding protein [Providencia rettgeri]MCF8962644.1 putative aliphatic sulfonates-binding protein [Providencia rettgeri]QWQ17300.1 ABC transporter substrate-binding protein [Providencia rettgeri]QWQ21135.1 ABC transporter substrate-binding protein [Providencia rettgeri]QWQ24971.1 ABC transporter substrate-binding protein [Providencia rettgeri]